MSGGVEPTEARAAAVLVPELIAEGASPGSSLHSWRCEHPDRYGPCTCVEDTAVELARALAAAGLLATDAEPCTSSCVTRCTDCWARVPATDDTDTLRARLAAVEAVAAKWEAEANEPWGHDVLVQTYRNHAREIRAALAASATADGEGAS